MVTISPEERAALREFAAVLADEDAPWVSMPPTDLLALLDALEAAEQQVADLASAVICAQNCRLCEYHGKRHLAALPEARALREETNG